MPNKKVSWLGKLGAGAIIILALQFAFASPPTLALEGAENVETPTETEVTEPVIEPVVEPVVTEPEITLPSEENSFGSKEAVSLEEQNNVGSTAELSTDKDDYHPDELVKISGTGFQSGQTVTLEITGGIQGNEDYITFTDDVVVNEQGTFEYNYQLDGFFRPLYHVSALDDAGNELDTISFTDAIQTDFAQCANEDPTLGDCNWIGSILQANNSQYFEGMTVAQRLLFRDAKVGNGSHSVSFTYQYTKGGIHAYDFLTTVNPKTGTVQGNNPQETLNPCADLQTQDANACNALNPAGNNPTLITVPNDPFNSKDSAPAPGTGSTQTQKEQAYETSNGGLGSRQIAAYFNGGTLTFGTVTLTHVPSGANSDTGDTTVSVTIPFTTAGCNNGDGCDLLFYFGGHLAVTGTNNNTNSNWGPGLGSSQISGGPYHIKDVAFDGAGGSQDNQIQGASILIPNNATITIVKDTAPNDSQDFNFTTTGTGLSSFSLDDDGETSILSNTKVFTGLAPGNYSVTEAAQTGFDLTGDLNCSDPTNNSTINLNTRTANINLAAGENVVCTFVNTKRGTIIVEKQTSPDGAAGSFTFTGNAAGTISDNGQITVANLVPGTYTSTENSPAPLFALTNITCDDNDSTGNLGTRTATFNLQAGETIKCTFTNTLQTGHIVVDKVTDPTGDPQSFSFTTTGTGYTGFSLTDAAAPNDQTLNAGNYSVAETVPAGWDLTSSTCVSSIQDTETPASLELDAGETITCTFTNQKDANIIVVKQTLPDGDSTPFSFTADYDNDGFSLSDGQQNDSGDLNPGTYAVSETVPANWNLTSATCNNGDDPSAINLDAGETITCTFTNTKNATIVVDKLTNPSGDPQSFNFTTTGTGYNGFSLTDAADPNSQSVVPGTYSVNETVPAGWVLVDARCVLNNQGAQPYAPGSNIVLAPGDTVQCFFNNRKESHIIVDKVTDPVGDPQSFTFTTTGSGYNGFALTDAALPNNQNLLPGTYSVTESLPAGWLLTSATCVSSKGDNETAGNMSLQAGETITCTFTNTKKGHIIVDKVTDPVGDPQSFSFTTTGAGYNGFSLTDAATPNDQELAPGTYSVAETVPAGWDLTSATCSDQSNPSSIDLDPGETVTCTFNNQKDAVIIVDKVTNPTGHAQSFSFTADYGNFSLTDNDAPHNSGDLDPDTYSVVEDGETGWDLTNTSCTSSLGGSEDNTAIALTAGETVTCVFTNTQRGAVIIDKNSIGGDDTFAFSGTGSGISANFDITTTGTVGTESFLNIEPGNKTITEAAPPTGWDFTNIVCQDPDNGSLVNLATQTATLDVDPGETVRCRFINTKRGHIVVDKVTDPTNDPQSFNFTTTGVGYTGFSLTDAADPNDQEVKPGAYTVAETVPAGWDLTLSTCDNDETPDSIDVGPGETITCTFTNTKRGHIIVDKVTDPAEDPQSFNFTAGGPGYDNFSLTDVATPDDQELVAGNYSVAETVPAGWDLTNTSCVSSIEDNETAGNIELDAGETVTCTFTNTKRGHLIVQKTTDPAGDTTVFTINASGSGTISGGGAGTVTDAADHDYEVTPDIYSVAETVPAGWDKTGDTCQNVVVAAGQTATCLLTNVKRGSITIVKDADPQDCQNFAFTMTGQTAFSLDDDANVVECLDTNQPQSATFSNLPVTNYTVTETLPNQFWEFGGITCVVTGTQTPYGSVVNVTNGVTITLNAGADVTCTFLNKKLSPTRTQGFWQTHTAFTSAKFAAHFPGGMPIGTAPHKGSITNTQSAGQSQLFGAFFSNIAQKSTGKGKAAQRADIDKARMQLLQQLVAAKLNCASFGCTSAVQTMIANADTAYAGNSISAILFAAGQMDAYNNSGDTIIIGNAGSATPQTSKSWANLGFWDLP